MIDSLRQYLQNFFGDTGLSWASFLGQMTIVIGCVLFFYTKIIKDSPAEKTVKGIVIFLFSLWIVAECCSLIHLRILSAMIRNLILLLILSGVVLFQPELRRLMTRLGNNVSLTQPQKKKIKANLIDILIPAIAYWRKTKTGALLVFENQEPVASVTHAGFRLDALLSSELLINLFFINTPLHDGAVLIKNGRIISAGLILPLSKDLSLTWHYGTRHRAAIGLTENVDALCLVVSEETGAVSLIKNGKIKTYTDMAELEKELNTFLLPLIKKEVAKSLWQRLKEIGKK